MQILLTYSIYHYSIIYFKQLLLQIRPLTNGRLLSNLMKIVYNIACSTIFNITNNIHNAFMC